MPKKLLDAETAFQEEQLLFLEKKIQVSIEASTNALEAGPDPFMKIHPLPPPGRGEFDCNPNVHPFTS